MATLAEQIRSLYGNRGDWNYGGIDRAAELADLLQKQGITDVSKIALQKGTRQEQQFSGGEYGQMNTVDLPANQVLFGDKRIGFAGDYNNDNTFGSNVSDYLKGDNTLGWSARGHGNVTYKVGTDPQGNNYLMPEWGSSSDMKDVRNDLKAAAVIAAMAYGLPMLGEAAGAAAGAGEAAAGTGLLSSAPLSTTLGAPLTELTSGGLLTGTGAPAAIGAPMGGVIAPEVMAAAAPELAAVAPEIAGPGLQTITTIGSKAAASTPWWAPAAVTAAAVPVLGGMTSTAADPYANETAKLERQQPGDLGNMGGPGTPEIPTITTTGPLDGLKAWAAANPELAKLLFSGGGALLSAAGGPSSSSPGGYVDSGYRPTISREGWNPAPQARQMAAQPTGLLMSPGKGEANSGLWRYAGLLDGAAGPSAPQMNSAMTPPMTPAMTPPRVTSPPMRATPPTTVRPVVAPAAASAPTTVRPAVAPASASAPTTAAARASSTGAAYELPSWAFKELGPTEKAALYNSFRSRGFNDDYIRTIVNRTQPQPDSDWSALTQLARQLPQGLIAGDQVPTKATIQQAVAGLRAQQPAAPQLSAQPTAPPAVQPAADAPIGVPYISPAQRLKNYAYEGGANDDVATRRGLGYARLMGWSPDEAVRNWNDALGTKITTDDYQRAMQAYGFTSGGLLGG